MLGLRILSYNLRSLRRSLGKTQEQMAATCGISYRLYQSLEVARGNPTLDSIERIASTLKVTVGELLALRSMTAATSEAFLSDLSNRFRESKLAVGVRDQDGVALWANKRATELHGCGYEKGPVDLMKLLSAGARETLKSQLECERRDVVRPYLNFVDFPDGSRRLFRYYPMTVRPAWGGAPFFSVVYITELKEDTPENYYAFCETVLR